MSRVVEVKIPDIGDFAEVEVIEILVLQGEAVQAEDSLVTLESDKATLEVPSPHSGIVQHVAVQMGDKVSEGSLILTLQMEESAPEPSPALPKGASIDEPSPPPESPPASQRVVSASEENLHAEVLVLGSGPGGYTAAFRAADLGKKVILVERYADLGGVCLNVGCIPSKALLHAAKVISEAKAMGAHGLEFELSNIRLDKLRGWKNDVVQRLTGGLGGLAKQRNVQVLQGKGTFSASHELRVETSTGSSVISFDQAIIAAGSESSQISGFPHDDPRVVSSTGALELEEIPSRLLVVGGGIIGLEMATVYHELGARVTVVELMGSLIAGADPDIVRPLHKRIAKQYENIFLNTQVLTMESTPQGIRVGFEGSTAPASDTFDRVLVAVGRSPNGKAIGAENAGVAVDARGFIAVDSQQRTNVSHIFAIGDIAGGPMLAHKALHEGVVAAEVAAGLKRGFDVKVIPSVAYTDPEIAWVGLTETEAKQQNQKYGKGIFPWAASGRSLSLGRAEGVTKLLFDAETKRVIGAGIVGPQAGDLIAEVALSIEMGCDAEDIGRTIHPHPTLSETIAMSAEAFEGTITDLYLPKGGGQKNSRN